MKDSMIGLIKYSMMCLIYDSMMVNVSDIRFSCGFDALSCAGAILKNQPVCYGTSRLKIRVCAVTRYALLKTPTLKSNKR